MYLTGRGDRDGRNADFQLSWNHADPAERLNKKLSIDRQSALICLDKFVGFNERSLCKIYLFIFYNCLPIISFNKLY